MSNKVDYTIIQYREGTGWWFCKCGKYEESSVLHGQDYCQLVQCYGEDDKALAQAKKEHPEAEVSDYYKPQAQLPTNPEPWFHEENAGEHWNPEEAY